MIAGISQWVLRLGATVWLSTVACSSSAPRQPQSSTGDGGLSLNLAPTTCPDAGALIPADAGACVTLEPRSFTRDIVPLFNGCAGEICHDFGGGAIASQIGIPSTECCDEISMIDPGHPERSHVLNKLTGKRMCAGWQMPLGQPVFNAQEIQAVSDWICQGAGTTP